MNELNLDLTPEQQKLADEVLAEMEEKLKQIETKKPQEKPDNQGEYIAEFSMPLPPEIAELYEKYQGDFDLEEKLRQVASKICDPELSKTITNRFVAELVVSIFSGEFLDKANLALSIFKDPKGVLAFLGLMVSCFGRRWFCERYGQN
jgi:hypothetical protein